VAPTQDLSFTGSYTYLHTDQDATVDQKLADTSCGGGCGGKGQEQTLVQKSKTKQDGRGNAKAKQNLVNVDLPFTLSLGKERRGTAKAV